MQKVNIEKKDGSIEQMDVEVYSRWACLVEAFGIIEKKSEEMRVPLDKMIKPLAIDDYIKDRYPAMTHDVSCEVRLGNI